METPADKPSRPTPSVDRVFTRPLAAPAAWLEPGRGIALYRTGLIVTIVVSIFAAFFGGVVGGRNMGLILVGPIVTTLTGLIMVVGIHRFAKQPAESGGSSMAKLAAVTLTISALMSVGELVMTYSILNGGDYSLDSLMVSKGVGGLCGVVGIFALLSSMRSVADYFEEPMLSAKIVSVRNRILVVVGIAAAVVLGIFAAPMLAGLGTLAIGIMAIVIIVRYIGVLGLLAERIDYHAHQVV